MPLIPDFWDWAKPLHFSCLSFMLCALMWKQDLFALPYQLLSVFVASVGRSRRVREEPFLLAWPAQSAMQSPVSCPHCHATPCLPVPLVPHPHCCAMLLITMLWAAHTPWRHLNVSVACSTVLFLSGWLPWTLML